MLYKELFSLLVLSKIPLGMILASPEPRAPNFIFLCVHSLHNCMRFFPYTAVHGPGPFFLIPCNTYFYFESASLCPWGLCFSVQPSLFSVYFMYKTQTNISLQGKDLHRPSLNLMHKLRISWGKDRNF